MIRTDLSVIFNRFFSNLIYMSSNVTANVKFKMLHCKCCMANVTSFRLSSLFLARF